MEALGEARGQPLALPAREGCLPSLDPPEGICGKVKGQADQSISGWPCCASQRLTALKGREPKKPR